MDAIVCPQDRQKKAERSNGCVSLCLHPKEMDGDKPEVGGRYGKVKVGNSQSKDKPKKADLSVTCQQVLCKDEKKEDCSLSSTTSLYLSVLKDIKSQAERQFKAVSVSPSCSSVIG